MPEQWYYYEYARRASRNIDDHPGLNYLKRQIKNTESILDFGCGEGTRLETLLPSWKKGTGIDINTYAVKQARKQYPRHTFKTYSGKKLPFKNNTFDLVYSAFVLEHTINPEESISEMIRVLKPRGQLIVLCPNFGAPNRRSPNSTKNPLFKLVGGFRRDFFKPLPDSLHWTKVKPKKTYKKIDDDTTVEPYIGSFVSFLRNQSLQIIKVSSLWELEPFSFNPRKFIITFLGSHHIYPFKLWGPQIFIAVKKQK